MSGNFGARYKSPGGTQNFGQQPRSLMSISVPRMSGTGMTNYGSSNAGMGTSSGWGGPSYSSALNTQGQSSGTYSSYQQPASSMQSNYNATTNSGIRSGGNYSGASGSYRAVGSTGSYSGVGSSGSYSGMGSSGSSSAQQFGGSGTGSYYSGRSGGTNTGGSGSGYSYDRNKHTNSAGKSTTDTLTLSDFIGDKKRDKSWDKVKRNYGLGGDAGDQYDQTPRKKPRLSAESASGQQFGARDERAFMCLQNMPSDITKEKIEAMFELIPGILSYSLQRHKYKHPETCIFVEMISEDAAGKLHETFNGMDVHGRRILCRSRMSGEEEKFTPDSFIRSDHFVYKSGTQAVAKKSEGNKKFIYVSDLPYNARQADLERYIGDLRYLTAHFVEGNKVTGQRGYAYLSCDTAEDAEKIAEELHGSLFFGCIINAKLDSGDFIPKEEVSEGRPSYQGSAAPASPKKQPSQVFENYLKGSEKTPLIGLEYVTEYATAQKNTPRYICDLCAASPQGSSVISHLTSSKHRMNYMEKKAPLRYARTIAMSQQKSFLTAESLKYAKEIEEREGRQLIKMEHNPKKVKLDLESKAQQETSIDQNADLFSRLNAYKLRIKEIEDKQKVSEKELNKSSSRPNQGSAGKQTTPTDAFTEMREQLVRSLTNTKEPILGLDFLNIQPDPHNTTVAPVNCQLCGCNLSNAVTVMQHIMGLVHRLEYFKRRHHDIYLACTKIFNRSAQRKMAADYAAKVERTDGRGSLSINGEIIIDSRFTSQKVVKSQPSSATISATNYQRKYDLLFHVNPLLGRGFTGNIKPQVLQMIKEVDMEMSDEEDDTVEKPKATLFDLIKAMKVPFVGLKYVTETQSYNSYDPPKYKCSLCTAEVAKSFIVTHLTGQKHRLAYIKENYPELQRDAESDKDTLTNYCRDIENDLGREYISVVKMIPPKDLNSPVTFSKPVKVEAPSVAEPEPLKPEEEDNIATPTTETSMSKPVFLMSKQEKRAHLLQMRLENKDKLSAQQQEELERQLKRDGKKADGTVVHFYDLIEKIENEPLLGLASCVEVWHPRDTEPPMFHCHICNYNMTFKQIVEHLIGTSHRMAFFKTEDPPTYRELLRIKNTAQRTEALRRRAREYDQNHRQGTIQYTVATDDTPWKTAGKKMNLMAYMRHDPSKKVSNTQEPIKEDTTEKSLESVIAEVVPKFVSEGTDDEDDWAEEGIASLSSKSQEIASYKTGSSVADLIENVVMNEEKWEEINAEMKKRISDGRIKIQKESAKFLKTYKPFLGKFPVIGLEWLSEIQEENSEADPWYICRLCHSKVSWNDIVDHVVSMYHRMMFIQKEHPTLHELLKESSLESGDLNEKIEEFARSIAKPPAEQVLEVLVEKGTKQDEKSPRKGFSGILSTKTGDKDLNQKSQPKRVSMETGDRTRPLNTEPRQGSQPQRVSMGTGDRAWPQDTNYNQRSQQQRVSMEKRDRPRLQITESWQSSQSERSSAQMRDKAWQQDTNYNQRSQQQRVSMEKGDRPRPQITESWQSSLSERSPAQMGDRQRSLDHQRSLDAESSQRAQTQRTERVQADVNIRPRAAGAESLRKIPGAAAQFPRLHGAKATRPLIGVEYLIEIQVVGKTKPPHYFCELCDCQVIPTSVLSHLYGFRHRSAFFEQHCPGVTVTEEAAEQYERMHGIGKVSIARETKEEQLQKRQAAKAARVEARQAKKALNAAKRRDKEMLEKLEQGRYGEQDARRQQSQRIDISDRERHHTLSDEIGQNQSQIRLGQNQVNSEQVNQFMAGQQQGMKPIMSVSSDQNVQKHQQSYQIQQPMTQLQQPQLHLQQQGPIMVNQVPQMQQPQQVMLQQAPTSLFQFGMQQQAQSMIQQPQSLLQQPQPPMQQPQPLMQQQQPLMQQRQPLMQQQQPAMQQPRMMSQLASTVNVQQQMMSPMRPNINQVPQLNMNMGMKNKGPQQNNQMGMMLHNVVPSNQQMRNQQGPQNNERPKPNQTFNQNRSYLEKQNQSKMSVREEVNLSKYQGPSQTAPRIANQPEKKKFDSRTSANYSRDIRSSFNKKDVGRANPSDIKLKADDKDGAPHSRYRDESRNKTFQRNPRDETPKLSGNIKNNEDKRRELGKKQSDDKKISKDSNQRDSVQKLASASSTKGESHDRKAIKEDLNKKDAGRANPSDIKLKADDKGRAPHSRYRDESRNKVQRNPRDEMPKPVGNIKNNEDKKRELGKKQSDDKKISKDSNQRDSVQKLASASSTKGEPEDRKATKEDLGRNSKSSESHKSGSYIEMEHDGPRIVPMEKQAMDNKTVITIDLTLSDDTSNSDDPKPEMKKAKQEASASLNKSKAIVQSEDTDKQPVQKSKTSTIELKNVNKEPTQKKIKGGVEEKTADVKSSKRDTAEKKLDTSNKINSSIKPTVDKLSPTATVDLMDSPTVSNNTNKQIKQKSAVIESSPIKCTQTKQTEKKTEKSITKTDSIRRVKVSKMDTRMSSKNKDGKKADRNTAQSHFAEEVKKQDKIEVNVRPGVKSAKSREDEQLDEWAVTDEWYEDEVMEVDEVNETKNLIQNIEEEKKDIAKSKMSHKSFENKEDGKVVITNVPKNTKTETVGTAEVKSRTVLCNKNISPREEKKTKEQTPTISVTVEFKEDQALVVKPSIKSHKADKRRTTKAEDEHMLVSMKDNAKESEKEKIKMDDNDKDQSDTEEGFMDFSEFVTLDEEGEVDEIVVSSAMLEDSQLSKHEKRDSESSKSRINRPVTKDRLSSSVISHSDHGSSDTDKARSENASTRESENSGGNKSSSRRSAGSSEGENRKCGSSEGQQASEKKLIEMKTSDVVSLVKQSGDTKQASDTELTGTKYTANSAVKQSGEIELQSSDTKQASEKKVIETKTTDVNPGKESGDTKVQSSDTKAPEAKKVSETEKPAGPRTAGKAAGSESVLGTDKSKKATPQAKSAAAGGDRSSVNIGVEMKDDESRTDRVTRSGTARVTRSQDKAKQCSVEIEIKEDASKASAAEKNMQSPKKPVTKDSKAGKPKCEVSISFD